MNSRSPRQLGLFSDGVRAVAETGGAKPPLTEADLQVGSKPRMRLHEMRIIRIWLQKEKLKGLAMGEAFRRKQARMGCGILAWFRRAAGQCGGDHPRRDNRDPP
jgi:hypothetical protein